MENKSLKHDGLNLSDAEDLQQSYSAAKDAFEKAERGAIKFVVIKLAPDCINDIQVIKDFIELCVNNGAKPVGVVFPVAAAVKKTYSKKLLKNFREMIHQLEKNSEFFCVDMLDLNLGQNYFSDATHLGTRGIVTAEALLNLKLYKKNLIPVENFCDMSYAYFNLLALNAPKDEYNALMENVFKASVQMIRSKDKIKIGFVLYDSAIWSGDELYNYFAQDSRFEVTIYLCLRADTANMELVRRSFLYSLKQFETHKLKVVPIKSPNEPIPEHDIFIFLTPYFAVLPVALHPVNITAKTLIAYVPYGFSALKYNVANHMMSRFVWKFFFTSKVALETYDRLCKVGMPRGLYSGYPKTDIFFDKNAKFHFDWKMTRPDAKKIIYAPHWSINSNANYATFQWNFKFMYEFAKAHPETSWVFKPHPNLLFSAITERVFPSAEALKEYLQEWDKLPNAIFYTGAYYQDIFATSDGMILDSCSFLVEYQFVDKPMIFLTRAGEQFNKIGEAILKASYTVDGRDLNSIAELMQKVFIDGKDDKAAKRKKVFDEYLNYPKYTGMSASEFIYKNIADEF